jgi:hypothetical protein
MKYLLPIFLLLFAGCVFAQSDLPEIGKIEDVKGKSKVYLIADGESKKAMVKKLDASPFVVVGKSDEAEIFIEYKTISRQPFGILPGATTETGQLDVFLFRDKKKIIGWSGSQTGGGFGGDTASKLLSKFVKELSKKK